MNRIFDRFALFVTGMVVALIKAVPLQRRRRTPSSAKTLRVIADLSHRPPAAGPRPDPGGNRRGDRRRPSPHASPETPRWCRITGW
jgi:hypothetical protein